MRTASGHRLLALQRLPPLALGHASLSPPHMPACPLLQVWKPFMQAKGLDASVSRGGRSFEGMAREEAQAIDRRSRGSCAPASLEQTLPPHARSRAGPPPCSIYLQP